jgi:hypothetical protein
MPVALLVHVPVKFLAGVRACSGVSCPANNTKMHKTGAIILKAADVLRSNLENKAANVVFCLCLPCLDIIC